MSVRVNLEIPATPVLSILVAPARGNRTTSQYTTCTVYPILSEIEHNIDYFVVISLSMFEGYIFIMN